MYKQLPLNNCQLRKHRVDLPLGNRYYKGMKNNTKSSITLPPNELKLVLSLMKSIGAKTKVEVIRRGLEMLKSSQDRDQLRAKYLSASQAARVSTETEIAALDHLTSEGLDK